MCVITMTNAPACAVMNPATLYAFFLTGTDTLTMGCDFDCGTRGKCSIRGTDGLPVELMSFGLE